MTDLGEAVRAYRSLGWATVRVEPCGKRPIGADSPLHEPDAFQAGDNVGVWLGARSGGLVDVDLDCWQAIALGPRFLPAITATFGREGPCKADPLVPLPFAPRHYLYVCPEITKTTKLARAHVEIRSTGGQTVFPGSVHESGVLIEWICTCAPAQIGADQLVQAFARVAIASVVARAWPGLSGARHEAVLALAGTLWHAGWTEADALAVLLSAMELDGSSEPHREQAIRDTWADDERNRYGLPKLGELLDPRDVKDIQRAIELAALGTPRAAAPAVESSIGLVQNDHGNADLVLSRYGEDLRFCPALGWLRWDVCRWIETEAPWHEVETTMAEVRAIATQVGGPTGQALEKWARQSGNSGRVRGCIDSMRHRPSVAVDVEQMDADPWLLNAPNGTIDLRSGELRPHARSDLCSRVVAVPYETTATCPRFVRFLSEVFGDWNLAAYVLRFLGYSLTGSTREQVFQLWVGGGSNGKSTLIETVLELLGGYAQKMAPELLVQQKQRNSAAASPDLARLRGARFTAGSEQDNGQRFDERLVKELTGTDTLAARHLHREIMEFRPTWKIVLAVNHKPQVRGHDRGIWRRIHVVPFAASFEGRENKELQATLRAEAPGILALLVQACLEWQRRGLEPPRVVADEVASYRASQDTVGQFLAEQLVLDAAASVAEADLYRVYRAWCVDAGTYCHARPALSRILQERGHVCVDRVWRGVRLVGQGIWTAKG